MAPKKNMHIFGKNNNFELLVFYAAYLFFMQGYAVEERVEILLASC